MNPGSSGLTQLLSGAPRNSRALGCTRVDGSQNANTETSAAESVRNTPSTDTMPASSSQTCCTDHPDPEGATSSSYLASSQEEDSGQSLPTAHVRPSHPLKSFAVPAIPPPGPPTYDPALPSTPLLSQQGEWGQLLWRDPSALDGGRGYLFFKE